MGNEFHKAYPIKKVVVGNEKTGHKIVTIPKDVDIGFGDTVLIYLHKRKNETKPLIKAENDSIIEKVKE